MPFDPLDIIGEILGEPAGSMRNPVNAGYLCPFIDSVCVKRGHFAEGPYPVCTVWRTPKISQLICVCPKRLFQIDIIGDVLKHVWPGEKPKNLRFAHEVKMKGFGYVDLVIADIDPSTNEVRNFISVELQAVDITGSYHPAYVATINNQNMPKYPNYGINWGNVRKRFVTQLISKGFFHHHWGTRMVAVLQEPLYKKLREDLNFDELPLSHANIVFMTYDYERSNEVDGYCLALKNVVGTSHSSLMNGTLYRQTPEKSKFCERIIANLR